MPSTLTWIDHDTEARDRMQRILALFEERDIRDELGLGAIRDSFSDLLFPGTSTIHTRLRYMLIVPWVYRHLEDRGVPSRRVPETGRELELDISESVLAAEQDTAGVFGASAGRKLKRLPSEVYWSGLEAWGIRRFRGARGRYHAALDVLRERRARVADEGERAAPDPSLTTWDPGLPAPPPEFPALPTLRLRRGEAEYLQERVARSCAGSYLAYLFQRPAPPEGSQPWEHPLASGVPGPIRHRLEQARLFSAATHGASLLYNLLLARAADLEDRVASYEERLERWSGETEVGELARWDLNALWTEVAGSSHRVTPAARRFVTEWVERVVAREGAVKDDEGARRLIRRREESMKRARSRFRNPRLLEQWGGASNPDAFTYRWSDVSVYLEDLFEGLRS